MNSKLEQLRSIRDKKQERIKILQQEVDALSKRLHEEENTEIVATIRSICLGPEDLANFLRELRGQGVAPVSHADDKINEKTEEENHEQNQ